MSVIFFLLQSFRAGKFLPTGEKKKSENFDATSILLQAMFLLVVSHLDLIVQTLSVINLLDRVIWLKYSNLQANGVLKI